MPVILSERSESKNLPKLRTTLRTGRSQKPEGILRSLVPASSEVVT